MDGSDAVRAFAAKGTPHPDREYVAKQVHWDDDGIRYYGVVTHDLTNGLVIAVTQVQVIGKPVVWHGRAHIRKVVIDA